MANITFMKATLPLLVVFIIAHALGEEVSPQGQEQTKSREFCYCLQQTVTGLSGPVGSVFFQESGEERVILVEQVGTARVYRKSGESGRGEFVRTFLDIRDRVVVTDTVGESRGLLSLVLDPVYDVNHRVYVYYIRNVSGQDWAYVSSFSAPDGVVDPTSERTLLRIYQPYLHGNGGPMLFGDDGYLYIVTGDGGLEDDPDGKAQDKKTFHGKVLRIDVDGPQSFTRGESGVGKLYGVPDSNPFVNDSQALEEVYAYGFRNMWGCSLDSRDLGGTGRMFCAETGTNQSDEINIIEKGFNYGWNIKEGSQCVNPGNCSILENEGVPIHEFVHTSQHSLVGGYVYRGKAFTTFNATSLYTYADVISGKLYGLSESSTTWRNAEFPHCGPEWCPGNARTLPSGHVFAFGQDREGELYIMTTDGFVPTETTGRLLKLVPPLPSSSLRTTPSLLWSTLTTLLALTITLDWTKTI